MLLHASLVLWVQRDPIVTSVARARNLFAFDATMRHPSEKEAKLATRANRANDATTRPPTQKLRAPPDANQRKSPGPGAAALVDRPSLVQGAAQSNGDGPPPVSAEPGSRIDLEKARRIAREYSHKTVDPRFDAAAGAANLLEPDRPGAKTLAKADRPDCRNEYAGWGLLAIPLLIRDTVANSGCKW
jgi:hypothetical protein